jgi:probable rRNA maturation factor
MPAPAQADMIEIQVTWNPRKDWRARGALERAARHALAAEGLRHGSLSIVVAGRRAMTTLHRRFMSIDAPTDVLTFDFGSEPTGDERERNRGSRDRTARNRLDAEIVVCADIARQRTQSIKAATAELCLYVVHGILHLAGYDDHSPGDFARMHAREDELLAEIGLGRVFGARQ